MTAYNIINSTHLVNGQPEDVSDVLANFSAIAGVINALDDSNLAAGAAVSISKLAGYPTDASKFLRGDGTWTNALTVGAAGTQAFQTLVGAQSHMKMYGDGSISYEGAVGGNVTKGIYWYAKNDLSWGALQRNVAGNLELDSQTGQTLNINKTSLGNIVMGGTVYIGNAGDTNLYRQAAGQLHVGGALISDSWMTVGYANTDTHLYFGAAADTNLYRASADNLKTDDSFTAALNMVAGQHMYVDNVGGGYMLIFGSASDTKLYRASANALKTDGQFQSVGNLYAGWTGSAWANALGTGGITSLQAVIARTANTVGYDIVLNPSFRNVGSRLLSYSVGAEAQPRFLIDQDGGFSWGPGGASGTDLNLYRASANVLKTDNFFYAGGDIVTRSGAASSIQISNASTPIILFGSAQDTNLYRSAASTLKTDGALVVVGDVIGAAGGSGASLRTRTNANALSFGWNGTTLQFYIDGTLQKTL